MKPLIFICFTALLLFSCKKNELESQDALKNELDRLAVPVSAKPIEWADKDLTMLDVLANKKVVGLGEATHGTAEFFTAKHRILKYLVEKHGFKVFAIEADFGESLYLNEAVRAGRTSEIQRLMREKMIFWTWATVEVQNLLEWMSEYNKNKPENQKVSYIGVDCQFNTHNAVLLGDYLRKTDRELFGFVENTLNTASTASRNNYAGYTDTNYLDLLSSVDRLLELMTGRKNALIQASNLKEFQLNERIAIVLKQVIDQAYQRQKSGNRQFLRDKYMADNTEWLSSYFDNQKIVAWAHNAHVENNPNFSGIGSQGYHLRKSLGNSYAILGFSFLTGKFRAVNSSGLNVQRLSALPPQMSVNEVFSRASEKNFFVDIQKLMQTPSWRDYLAVSRIHLSIGAVFNGDAKNYYQDFRSDGFDYMIHFDQTTTAIGMR